METGIPKARKARRKKQCFIVVEFDLKVSNFPDFSGMIKPLQFLYRLYIGILFDIFAP